MTGIFDELMRIIQKPIQLDRGVKTDSSILLVYPPDKELLFREQLLDSVVPELVARQLPHHLMDLTDFLFHALTDEEVRGLEEDEFDDYPWMLQGLSRRVENALQVQLENIALESPGTNLLIYSTVALYPVIRFGEVLRELRDLKIRIILAFPGEERGGKLHFMNQSDGGNYLAVKLFWR